MRDLGDLFQKREDYFPGNFLCNLLNVVDCEFFVHGTSIYAHKLFLKRVPEFSIITEQSLKIREGKSIVELKEDINPDVFKLFLRYIYTDTLPKLSQEQISDLIKLSEIFKTPIAIEKCMAEDVKRGT